MTGELSLDPLVVGVVLAMAVVTYATKAGGLWLLGRVEPSERAEAGLDALPGAVVVAILAPELVGSGPPGWLGAAVVALVTHRTGSVLLAMVTGVGSVVLLRGL
ncbi:AzlD domain-containing protein [Haloarculaceae archaeon H-GB11]|nr:AzlD domain-containing protein [Haloarculaceae archaeon H-GB11]